MPAKKKTKTKSNLKFIISKEEKLFPHKGTFIWRLEDNRENKTCWFQCQDHVEKYLTRYKLDNRHYKCLFFDK